jgi:lysyl-tRNA synthetase class 2
MNEYSTLEKIRLEKIEELRAEGIEPYPTRAERTHTAAEAIAAFESAEKEAGAGNPPANEIMPGLLAMARISRTSEALRRSMRVARRAVVGE